MRDNISINQRSILAWLTAFLDNEKFNRRASASLTWFSLIGLVCTSLFGVLVYITAYIFLADDGTRKTSKVPGLKLQQRSISRPLPQNENSIKEFVQKGSKLALTVEQSTKNPAEPSELADGPAEARSRGGIIDPDLNSAPLNDCDFFAANPADPMRLNSISNGIEYSTLAWKFAIPACEKAVREHPNETRFAYQLARSKDVEMKESNNYSDVVSVYQEFENVLAAGHGHALHNMSDLLEYIPEGDYCPTKSVCVNRFLTSGQNSAVEFTSNWMVLSRFYANNAHYLLPCNTKQACIDEAFRLAGKALSEGDGDAEAYQGYLIVEKGVSSLICAPDDCNELALSLLMASRDQGTAWGTRWLGHFYKDDSPEHLCGGRAECDRKSKEAYVQAVQLGDAWAHNTLGDLALTQPGFVGCSDKKMCVQYAVEKFQQSLELKNYDRAIELIQLLRDRPASSLKCADRNSCDKQIMVIIKKLEKVKPYVAAAHLGYMTDIGRSDVECKRPDCDLESIPFYEVAESGSIGWAIANFGAKFHHKENIKEYCDSESECNKIAFAKFKTAAELGNAWAYAKLGQMYEYDSEATDCLLLLTDCLNSAYSALKKSAEKGSGEGQVRLTQMTIFRNIGSNCEPLATCKQDELSKLESSSDSVGGWRENLLGWVAFNPKSKELCESKECRRKAVENLKIASVSGYTDATVKLIELAIDEPDLHNCTKTPCVDIIRPLYRRLVSQKWSYVFDYSPLESFWVKWKNVELFSDIEEFELVNIAVNSDNSGYARAHRVELMALSSSEEQCTTVSSSCKALLEKDLKKLSAANAANAVSTLSINAESCNTEFCQNTSHALFGIAAKSDNFTTLSTLIEAYLNSGLLCSFRTAQCSKEAIEFAQSKLDVNDGSSLYAFGTALAPISKSESKAEAEKQHVKKGMDYLKQAQELGNNLAKYHLILWSITKADGYSTGRLIKDVHGLDSFFDLPPSDEEYFLSAMVRQKLNDLFVLNASTISGQQIGAKLLLANILNDCSYAIECDDEKRSMAQWVKPPYVKLMQRLVGSKDDGNWGEASQKQYSKWVETICSDPSDSISCQHSLMIFALKELANKDAEQIAIYFEP